MSTAQTKCDVCEIGNLVPELVHRTIEIDGENVDVPSRHHWCDACGVIQAVNDDLRFNARATRAVTKQRRGLQTGVEVRSVRKRLCLKQEEAAKIFGGGPVAFSKYENDDILQSEAMDRLIWIAGEFPWIVAALAERLGISLSEEASVVIDRFGSVYREEYLAQAQARFCSTRIVFEGFRELIPAKLSKQTYRSRKDSRPATHLSS